MAKWSPLWSLPPAQRALALAAARNTPQRPARPRTGGGYPSRQPSPYARSAADTRGR
jgi:hypothetical protein